MDGQIVRVRSEKQVLRCAQNDTCSLWECHPGPSEGTCFFSLGNLYLGIMGERRAHVALLVAGFAFVSARTHAQQQAFPDAPVQQTGQQTQQPASKPAASDFPFPDTTPKKTDAKDFPFPDKADQPSIPPAAPEKEAPPPGFSSSVTLHDEGSSGGPTVASPARAAEDAKVGKQYWNLGNYEGAYLRYRDAVLYAPEDAALWFGLAEAERGLGRYSKAREDYGKVIKLAADSKEGREAEKTLRKLPTKDKPQPQGPGPKLP